MESVIVQFDDRRPRPLSDGTGKPEASRGDLSGLWPRRTAQARRMADKVADELPIVHSLHGHHEN